MYRVGLPFWKTFAKIFGSATFRVEVAYDRDARVFIATSPDLKGFVVEAATADELLREANDVVAMLMDEHLNGEKMKIEPVYRHFGTAIANA